MNKLKKVFVAALAVIITLLSFLGIRSCSQGPSLEEVKGRLAELIEASYGVNEILFGKGPAVYPKVYENNGIPYKVGDRIYYYYTLTDDSFGEIFALQVTKNHYLVLETEARAGEEYFLKDTEGRYFYEIEYTPAEDFNEDGNTEGPFKDATSGKVYHFYLDFDEELDRYVYYYANRYARQYLVRSAEADPEREPTYVADGYFYYEIEYTEPTYKIYHTGNEPAGYSYIDPEGQYCTPELIKGYAESVYSRGYLAGVYEMLFTGAAISDSESGIRGARYYEYAASDGRVWLMSSDEYESLIPGKRIYDLSTAKIVRPRRRDFVNIEIESYLEGQPDVRIKVKLSMIKQDGVWMLDSATY